ncbi:MAG: hypothetical protein ACKODX_09740 [Gemmata sp.]|mgnify:CR=1 FL=1
MSSSAKTQPQTAAVQPDEYPPYRRVYVWIFQSWLIMFLGVICITLFFYLWSYVPRR